MVNRFKTSDEFKDWMDNWIDEHEGEVGDLGEELLPVVYEGPDGRWLSVGLTLRELYEVDKELFGEEIAGQAYESVRKGKITKIDEDGDVTSHDKRGKTS